MTVRQVTEGWSTDHPVLRLRAERRGVRRDGHRHRHPARKAEAHLRSVPSGRRRHEPQVRRHGPRPRDQPRAGRRCSAAKSGSSSAPGRAARSRCTCRSPTSGPRARRAAVAERVAAGAVAVGRCRCSAVTTRRGADRRRPRRHHARRQRRCSSSTTIRTTRAILLGLARDKGFKGIVAHARPDGAVAGARIPADGDHARRVPARHARLDRPQQPQARSDDAAHSGADALGRGGAPARPRRTARSRTS